MERDGIIAHGATNFLKESMLFAVTIIIWLFVIILDLLAIYNNSQNLFISPMSDGPIQFVGTLDDHLNIENVSRFGRSFSIVRIPYSFKLLLQELQTMNVQMLLAHLYQQS